MISNAELEHTRAVKQWSQHARKVFNELMTSEPLINKLLSKLRAHDPSKDVMRIHDNIDWLIALIEREAHTQRVNRLADRPSRNR
jgi:hypothetical protein